ncbi:MAG TPA: uroporphyrinogen decarboxylase [Gemmatimonadales bacterium]|nr:uroporphyrinogen decarboxylase [Gemmatimonadales bacterium]
MAVSEAPLLAAAARRPAPVTPIWFMRQAGRYMPEYRALRERHTLLELCAQPELITEVTLQPVRALGVDAAILFADILLPLVPMGLDLGFVAGEGPAIANPVRTAHDIASLRAVDPEADLGAVLSGIRILSGELPPHVPLIGFVGGPFTVGTYAVEGGPARQALEAKRMMHAAPELWHALMQKLTVALGDFLVAQVRAGARVVQLFDSWAGLLDAHDYRTHALPYSRAVLERVADLGVPRIHFGVGASHLLPAMRETGAEVLGLDWRTSLDEGWASVGPDRAVQGNLDPAALFAPLPELRRRVDRILERAAGRDGHIFNLGHGILPGTPVDHVRAVVDYVHERTAG